MLIQNYGLFWREDYVFWGRRRNAGRLSGVLSTKGPVVDFRDQIGVYVLYADYKMLYVGQAGNGNQKLFERLRNHRSDPLSGRWNQFSWFGTRWVKGDGQLANEVQKKSATAEEVLNHLEAVLIYAAEPSLNRQGGKFGSNVQHYIQARDPQLEPTYEEMVTELWKNKQTTIT